MTLRSLLSLSVNAVAIHFIFCKICTEHDLCYCVEIFTFKCWNNTSLRGETNQNRKLIKTRLSLLITQSHIVSICQWKFTRGCWQLQTCNLPHMKHGLFHLQIMLVWSQSKQQLIWKVTCQSHMLDKDTTLGRPGKSLFFLRSSPLIPPKNRWIWWIGHWYSKLSQQLKSHRTWCHFPIFLLYSRNVVCLF